MVVYWVLDSSGESEHQASSDGFNVGCLEGTAGFFFNFMPSMPLHESPVRLE